MADKIYIAIDLKSFYASVECADLSLDPLDTNLVVADESRTEKTICLAVSPSLKAYGISGRARLFEVVEKVKQINSERLVKAPNNCFTGKSCIASELKENPSLELSYIAAPPQMARYIEISTRIYKIYLKYVAPEDIHVYSIDEVFIDITGYLKIYRLTPHEFAMMMIRDVLSVTGITATAGIGTNLYLCKIAMDIVAKHIPPDKDGVRIAYLDEHLYRQKLWAHQPLTDFWRVGPGLSKKLIANGLYTMGDIARCSLGKPTEYYNEALLYKLFGVNAELLIDHAWGWEPCSIRDIKAYKPKANSICSGQVLHCPYEAELACLVLKEMAIQLSEELMSKKVLTDHIVLTVSYDVENLLDEERMKHYSGEIVKDHYGRFSPKRAHGSINLPYPTSLPSIVSEACVTLYKRIVNQSLLIRKLNITAAHIIPEVSQEKDSSCCQMNLFTDFGLSSIQKTADDIRAKREKDIETAIMRLKKRHGKNAVLKGISLTKGATAMDRNRQIGGHRA